MLVPNLAVRGAGKDGLLALLLGTAGAFFYAMLLLFLSNRLTTDYMSECKEALGKTGTFLIGFLYLVKYFISCVFLMTLFTTIIHETILPYTNYRIILLFLFLVAMYYGAKQFEVRARLVELLYFIILIPLFLLFALGIFKINPVNLSPLFTSDSMPLLQTGYLVLLTYSALETLLFSAPSVTDKETKELKKKKVLSAILICGIFNFLIFVVVLGLLGTYGTTQKIWSTISVMQMIEIPGGFVHRQDAIMLAFWMCSIFTIISTLIYYLCFITKSMLCCRQQKYILWFYAAVLFACTMKPLTLDTLYFYFGKYMAYIGFPQSILLPAFVILVSRIRKGKVKHHEKNAIQS